MFHLDARKHRSLHPSEHSDSTLTSDKFSQVRTEALLRARVHGGLRGVALLVSSVNLPAGTTRLSNALAESPHAGSTITYHSPS